METVNVMLVGGPTLLIEFAGYRILTDPTFDAPQVYHHPIAGEVVKNQAPAVTPEALGHIDLALVSHEHIDNLDVSGRGFLTMIPLALTTNETASRFGSNVEGLNDYESKSVQLPDGRELKITAVPAHHGPEGVWEALGPVIGFILEADGMPTIYFSGDNSALDVVADIASRFPDIDIAILNAGGAKFDAIADGAYITFSNESAMEATKLLGAKKAVVVHEDSWAHFSQDAQGVTALFAEAGMGEAIVALAPGESRALEF